MVMGVRMARYGCQELGIDDPPIVPGPGGVRGDGPLRQRRRERGDRGDPGPSTAQVGGLRQAGRHLRGSGQRARRRVAPRPEVPHAGREDDPLEFWNDWTDEQLFTCTPVTIDHPRGGQTRTSRPQSGVRGVWRGGAGRPRRVRARHDLSAGPAPTAPTIRCEPAREGRRASAPAPDQGRGSR